jgi:4-hydroxymandelate oxidase
LTVDAAIIGTRERDARNRFHLPAGLVAANLMGTGRETLSRSEHGSALSHYVQEQLKTDMSWSDLEWLRAISPVPVLIKGLVHPDDATQAIRCGASGLVVSNHGGRQLDTAPSTAAALPAVIEAVGGRVPVLVDGGIRRGTDIVKAMAMGAAAVLVGRPVLWGLAVGGAEGVRSMLEMLRTELDEAMALCGCASLAQLPSDLVRANGGPR